MRRNLAMLAGGIVAAALVATAMPATAAENVPGGGASFPYAFMQQCVADFNASQSNFTMSYQSTGSGTGKSNFTKGTFVYGQTDSKYSSGEPTFGWEYIPNIGGAIVFPINLKKTTGSGTLGSAINLKQSTLAKIMGGVIKTWNDPEILKSNPAIAKLIPAQPIVVVYRSGNSGTSNNTLQYLNAWAPSIFAKVQDDFGTAFPGGKPPAGSLTGKDNAAVLQTIVNTPGAIGYVDLSDARAFPNYARIENALGQFVIPSATSAAKTLAQQTAVGTNGLVTLNYGNVGSGLKVANGYPVVIFSYALARTDGKGPNGLGVRQFQQYVIAKCGPAKATGLGYVPVGGKVLQTAIALTNSIK